MNKKTNIDSSIPQVAHLVLSLEHGGLEQCAIQWCRTRNEMYTDSTVIICLDELGPLATVFDQGVVYALHANRSRFPWDQRAVSDLRQLLGVLNIDIIHSHNVAARQYAALAHMPGLQHVNTDHGTNQHTRGLLNKIRYYYTRWHTDMVVAVSKDAARKFSHAFNSSPNEVVVIENGVDCREKESPSRTTLRNQFGFLNETPLVGYVGRLSYEKGVDRLIRSMVTRDETGIGTNAFWQLLVVGDGPESTRLRELSKSLNVESRVYFIGAIPDAVDMLHVFDLLLLPSRSEGLPLVLLEAMSRSVPVLVTDVGENRAVIDNGRCGYLLPDNDNKWPGIICETLDLVMQRSDRSRTDSARQRVQTLYSIDRTLAGYEKVYSKGEIIEP